MKIFTLNFLTCPHAPCKSSPLSFPLHPRSGTCELEHLTSESETSDASQTLFLENMLNRIEWPALRTICTELGLPLAWDSDVPPDKDQLWDSDAMEDSESGRQPSKLAKDLYTLLMETSISEGTLVCGACGHEFFIKEGIANFLLPGHMV